MDNLNTDTILIRNEKIFDASHGDFHVIFNLESGYDPLILNHDAYAILECIDGKIRIGEIYSALRSKRSLKEYDMLISLLSTFLDNNLVHPKGIKPNDANDIITELSQMNGDDEIIKILIDRNGEKMMFDVKTNYRLSEEYTPDKAK